MIDRRSVLVGLAALARPRMAGAQPAAKLPRIGLLHNSTPRAGAPTVEPFLQGLRELGYVEGQTIAIEYRWADGVLDRHPRLVAELVALNVDVIVLAGSQAARAAIQATPTIPIVAAILGDPVTSGLVASLARPGGNLTGLAWQTADLVTKQLQLLKETVPGVSRVAALWQPGGPASPRAAAEKAAAALGLQLDVVEVEKPGDIPGAFERAKSGRAGAVIVLPSPMFNAERRRLAELAASHRLPAMYEVKEYVQAGGLMSYGPSFGEMYRRAATYVDRILKGAKPGDLPLEQPTKFELVINSRTAQALGLTIPPSVLLRADHVIR